MVGGFDAAVRVVAVDGRGQGGEVGETDACETAVVFGGILDTARPCAGTASSRQVNPVAGGTVEQEVVGVLK